MDDQQLESALLAVRDAADRLKGQIRAINDATMPIDLVAVDRFASLAREVTHSPYEQLRENLLSAYALAYRPELDHDDVEFSYLLLDKRINDARDALLAAEKMAELSGAPPPPQTAPTPNQLLIPVAAERQEVEALRASVSKISNDISGIKVGDVLNGAVNIQIKSLEIKVDLAAAILAVRQWIDALNLERNLRGVREIARRVAGLLVDKTAPLFKMLSGSMSSIISVSSDALKSVGRLIEKHRKGGRDDGDIWSESEVLEMLSAGKPVPRAAAPFVRSLNLHQKSYINIDDVAKLVELRKLAIQVDPSKHDISKLSELRQLRELDVQVSGHANFQWINDLEKLEILRVRTFWDRQNVLTFPKEVALRNLRRASFLNMTIDEVSSFSACEHLTELAFEDVRSDDFSRISSAKKLRKLSLDGTNPSNLGFLSDLHELEDLDLRNMKLPDLHVTRTLPSIQVVRVSRRFAGRNSIMQISNRAKVVGDHGGRIRGTR